MSIRRDTLALTLLVASHAAAQTRSAPAVAPPPTAIVHVDAANPAVQLEVMNAAGDFNVACSGTCDRALPARASYRIAGGGIRYSEPFVLAAPPNAHATIHATTKSSVLHATGLILLGVGIAAAGVGGFVAVIAALGSISGTINQSVLTSGLVIGSLGVATIVPGVILSVMNGPSQATVTF